MAVDAWSPRSARVPWPSSAQAGDGATLEWLAAVDDRATREAVVCERAFLAELGSGCSLPVGAHAVVDGDGSSCGRSWPAPGASTKGSTRARWARTGWAAEAAGLARRAVEG